MLLLKQFLFAYLATFGFAILFSVPKESICTTSFIGACGWTVHFLVKDFYSNIIVSSFFGALTIGVLSEIFARLYKKPATLYVISGIIPLVPGGGMYYTMKYIIEEDLSKAGLKGVETFLIAAAIAFGLVLSTMLSQSINKRKTDY